MNDYIKREALRDVLYNADAITMNGVKILNQFPASDVAPVVHGRWITKKAAIGKKYTICSACDFALYYMMAGDLTPLNIRNAKYCPNCGAEIGTRCVNKNS